MLGVIASAVAAVALWWALGGRSPGFDGSGDGCVTVAFPSSMGGGIEHQCGAAAHDWCRTAGARQDAHALAVQAQCRVAGIRP
ncbi:hypothetical protein BMW24_002650 [Mycobacterium heckeshornense]|nr:hypothetical protein ACT16_00345 [Mycobacterium heckeshornense]PIJ37995.1 hypothetical protein BMW24_002650 [Mycobacterium heckeshornense]